MRKALIVGLLLAGGAAWGGPAPEEDPATARRRARLEALLDDVNVATKVALVKGDEEEAARLLARRKELEAEVRKVVAAARRIGATDGNADLDRRFRGVGLAELDRRRDELGLKAADLGAAIASTKAELAAARKAGDDALVARKEELLAGLTDTLDQVVASRAAIERATARKGAGSLRGAGGTSRLADLERAIADAKRIVAAATDRGDFDTAAKALQKARALVGERDRVRAALAREASRPKSGGGESTLADEVRSLRAEVAELRAVVAELRKAIDERVRSGAR